MATETLPRFRFDFADLAPPDPPPLRVLTSEVVALPPGAAEAPVPERPRWLGRLLAVIRTGEPLRVEIGSAAAPAFAEHLLATLTAIFAAAGTDAGLSTLSWPGGLAVGAGRWAGIPAQPQLRLLAADLSRGSVATALGEAGAGAGRPLLVLNGRCPGLDRSIGLPVGEPGAGLELARLPLLKERDLRGLLEPGRGFGSRGHGLACSRLAARLVAIYRDAGVAAP